MRYLALIVLLSGCGTDAAMDEVDAGADASVDAGADMTAQDVAQDEPPYEGPVGEPEQWTCGTVTRYVAGRPVHIDPEEGELPEYVSSPPCIGSHYGRWLDWGEYENTLDAGFYVHNLEHGGIAFLYRCPAGCEADVETLREYVAAVPDDDGGPFRHMLGPFDDMPTKFALAAWGVIYVADELCIEDLDRFRTENYRMAPEDVAAPGDRHDE